MAEAKWIKIVTDIFDDEKILLIETLPEADSIIVIWFKLLCLAGKQNNKGVFMLNEKIPYNIQMFSTIFRRKETTVQLAFSTFERFGMIEIIDDVIMIPNWGKHQSLDQLENKKEYMRGYMQEYREKQKLIAECKTNSKTNSKTNVSQADKNRLYKQDKKDKQEEIIKTLSSNEFAYSEIINHLNNVLGTSYKPISKDTQKHINARLNEGFTIEDFKMVIDKKVLEWGKKSDMMQFLRPSTLFGTKFESYLNQPWTNGKKLSKTDMAIMECLQEMNSNQREIKELITYD